MWPNDTFDSKISSSFTKASGEDLWPSMTYFIQFEYLVTYCPRVNPMNLFLLISKKCSMSFCLRWWRRDQYQGEEESKTEQPWERKPFRAPDPSFEGLEQWKKTEINRRHFKSRSSDQHTRLKNTEYVCYSTHHWRDWNTKAQGHWCH